MSLASKLPWTHRFAGGYPGIGSQPLPIDADAIDYLSRMATADGAGVETGVATAVDAFFRDAKAAGVFDALKACCILAGARTLAGALVPVVGDAPTNVADGFVEGDYSRTDGLTGDGATTYLDSGRAGDDDLQDDCHLALYVSTIASGSSALIAAFTNVPSAFGKQINSTSFQDFFTRFNTSSTDDATSFQAGFAGATRADGDRYFKRNNSSTREIVVASTGVSPEPVYVFASSLGQVSDASIAFYSIGDSLGSNPADGLAALDTAVTNLITAIGAAL
jgi:hypothetical protein